MTTTTIYGLCDPRSGHLRYIGKTSRPLDSRVGNHLSDARQGKNGHRNNWIRLLASLGLVPEAFEIERVTGNGADEEIYHIAQFRSIGCDLTNMTDGGEGITGWQHSPKTKAKISVTKKGHKVSVETRAKMSLAHLGRKGYERSPETIAKCRASNLGRKLSPETRAKMSAAAKRRVSS